MKRGMKSSLLYLLPVGLPVVALKGVVRLGQHITSPTYVGGLWRTIEASTTRETCNSPGFRVDRSGCFDEHPEDSWNSSFSPSA